jgi:3-methyl-2-oxobutanoate hydroxymethyltransferase
MIAKDGTIVRRTFTQAVKGTQHLTIPMIRERKVRKGARPLVMLTAYDAPTARLAAESGIDMLLVGDSVGTAVLGYESTVPVTLADIIHHAKAVRRGAPNAHVVADLPFMTYQVSDEQAVTNAGRLLQEAGVNAVKLEAGQLLARRVRAIAQAGIPVVGHVGLTPQTADALGGMRVQGQDIDGAREVLANARAVADAGAYALVIEVVPAELGRIITEQLDIPTIGIGAGPDCDGQVLVWTDLVGLTAKTDDQAFQPRFVQQYLQLNELLGEVFATFANDVRSGTYPRPEQTYAMKANVAADLRSGIEAGRDR